MSYIEELFDNKILFVVLFAWFISCVLKGLILVLRGKKINATAIFGSGGMPSSHSTVVTCLAICIGVSEGFDSAVFVVACVLAFVVMYDASGVRRAAGEHAKVINMIVELWEEQDLDLRTKKLKEILGHSPVEVACGAVLGILIAVIAAVVIGL